MSRLAGLGLVVGAQLLVFLVLLEIVARIADPIGISYFAETARFFDNVIVEEPIGYRLKPGLKDSFNGVPVEINDLGMRDRPVPDEKAPDEFRILAMGDSVIFSVGVPVEASIPRLLEERLNESAPEGRNYRVLNMGVPSYNTVQQLEQYKQVGQHLQADAAFLFIIPNDLRDKLWVLSKRSNPIVDLSQRSYALGLIFYAGRWIAAATGLYKNPNVSTEGESDEFTASQEGSSQGAESFSPERLQGMSDEEIYAAMERVRTALIARKLGAEGWQNIETSLVDIRQRLAQDGVPLLVFHRDTFDPVYVDRLQDLGNEHGFDVRELTIFKDPRWENLDKADYVNSPVDSHCNVEGCKLYAQRMHELIDEVALLK